MTDQYLVRDASYNRLLAEYQKYGSLVIGVDFDQTLFDYHATGASHEQVRQLVRDMYELDFTIKIWTANWDIDNVKKVLVENNIPYHGINDGGIPLSWNPAKPHFSALLDDRCGLIQVYNDLRKLVNYINYLKLPETII